MFTLHYFNPVCLFIYVGGVYVWRGGGCKIPNQRQTFYPQHSSRTFIWNKRTLISGQSFAFAGIHRVRVFYFSIKIKRRGEFKKKEKKKKKEQFNLIICRHWCADCWATVVVWVPQTGRGQGLRSKGGNEIAKGRETSLVSGFGDREKSGEHVPSSEYRNQSSSFIADCRSNE